MIPSRNIILGELKTFIKKESDKQSDFFFFFKKSPLKRERAVPVQQKL